MTKEEFEILTTLLTQILKELINISGELEAKREGFLIND